MTGIVLPPLATGAVLTAFRDSEALCRAAIGPIYGGRKTAAVREMLRRCLKHPAPSWRWTVVRARQRDLGETIRAWHRAVPLEFGEWSTKGLPRHRIGGADCVIGGRQIPEMDVVFVGLDRPDALDQLRHGETTAIWLDAAREMPEDALDAALEAIGTWPSELRGGAPWQGIIVTSRMPMADHWIPRRFREGDPEYALFRQPGGLCSGAENVLQLAAAGFSYERAARAKACDWVRVHVDAEFGQTRMPPEEVRRIREEISGRLTRLREGLLEKWAELEII